MGIIERTIRISSDVVKHAYVNWMLHLPEPFSDPILVIAILFAMAVHPAIRRRPILRRHPRRNMKSANITVIDRNGYITSIVLKPGDKVVLNIKS